MSQNRDDRSADRGRPHNLPENPPPNPDAPAELGAIAQPDTPVEEAANIQFGDDDDAARAGETNWDAGDLIYVMPDRNVIRYGFPENDVVVPGQLPEITERRIYLQDSPTSRRRLSLHRDVQRVSPSRTSPRDSPDRSGSEPPPSRRNRGTQTPPMDRKWGQSSKKPEDPKQ